MACTPLPTPPAPPALPGGITITPTLPSPSFDEALCCKIPQLPVAPALPGLPPGVFNPGVAEVLETILASVSAFKDALPLSCAKE